MSSSSSWAWWWFSLSVMSDSATLWTVVSQAPLSMGFPRQECWSGLPFLSPGDLANSGTEPGSPACNAGRFFTSQATRKVLPMVEYPHLGSHRTEVSVALEMGTGSLGLSQFPVHLVLEGRAPCTPVTTWVQECLPRLAAPAWGPPPLGEVIPLGDPGISWGYFGVQGTLPAPLLSCLLCPLAGQGQINSLLLAPVTIHLTQLVLLHYKPAPN